MKKKGSLQDINGYLIGFVGLVVIVIAAIMFISTLKQTSLVCSDVDNEGLPVRYKNGVCQACKSTDWVFNTTGDVCCNETTTVTHCKGVNQSSIVEYDGMAHNGTKQLQIAAALPPQFMPIIVIIIMIVGIIGMLALIGYSVYSKMRNS